jgi:predicted TIM-barrel fold metal-dependent hydrolase
MAAASGKWQAAGAAASGKRPAAGAAAESTVLRRMLASRRPPVAVIDCHGHLGTHVGTYIPSEGRPEAVVAEMDRLGVRTLCLSHCMGIGPDFREGNRLACEAAAAWPGRIAVYLAWNPHARTADALEHLGQYAGRPGVVGIKLHTSHHEVIASDPRYLPAYEFAQSHRMIVLCHTWGVADVLGIERMIRRFPAVPVILGHSGGYEFAAIDEAVRIARENGNAWLDLCLSGMFEGLVETFVREAGARKVLFGSDSPYMDCRANLGRVLFARIADGDKELILNGNARGLLAEAGFRVPEDGGGLQPR